MIEITLKSSEDWSKIHNNILIYDPDGWDRKNFEESWNELITEDEYMKRLAFSTCSRIIPPEEQDDKEES